MLYIARFNYDQDEKGKEERTGSFEVLIEANDPESAAEACRPYLEKIVQKEKRDAFSGHVVVFLSDLFEVRLPLSSPALINFKDHPSNGFSELFNPMLDGPSEVTPYRWGDPEKESHETPFATFEPAPARTRIEGSRKSKPVTKKPR
jgi:hypothetical protein